MSIKSKGNQCLFFIFKPNPPLQNKHFSLNDVYFLHLLFFSSFFLILHPIHPSSSFLSGIRHLIPQLFDNHLINGTQNSLTPGQIDKYYLTYTAIIFSWRKQKPTAQFSKPKFQLEIGTKQLSKSLLQQNAQSGDSQKRHRVRQKTSELLLEDPGRGYKCRALKRVR